MWNKIQHYANSLKLRSELFLELRLAKKNGRVLPWGIDILIWRLPHLYEPYIWLLRYFPNQEKTLLIDVGGNSGYWAENFVKFYPNTKIIGFEPVKQMYEAYHKRFQNKSNVYIYNKALSFEEGTLEINVAKDFGLTSFFQYDQKQDIRNSEFTTKEVVCLDCLDNYKGIILEEKINTVLKIDVQGFELNVLKGATEILKAVDVLIIECSFLNEYINELPTFPLLTSHLIKYDFYPVLFGVYNYKESLVGWERDVLFIKKSFLDISWGY